MSKFKALNVPVLTANGIQPDWMAAIRASLPPEAARAAIEAAKAQMRADLALDPNAPPIDLQSGADILATAYPEPAWAIPNMLPVGLGLLASKPKMGKSWLAMQIAQALTCGGYVLSERVEVGQVLFLALEDSKRRLQQRMRTQGWRDNAANIDFMVLKEYQHSIGDLANGGNEIMARQIKRKGYRLVIIDTLSRAFSTTNILRDQNKTQEVTNALSPLQEIALESDCAILLIDHHNKLAGGHGLDAISDVTGSLSKGGVADTVWGLYRERGKSEAKLQITGRDIDEITLALTFDKLTGCWQSEGDYYRLKMTERRQQIVDYLKLVKESTNGDIAAELAANTGTISRELKEMLLSNILQQRPDGRKIYYSINKDVI